MMLSCWWMTRFVYGPLEWLLRAVTIAACGQAGASRERVPPLRVSLSAV
ncbi:DUF418 domain-containing protein [Aminobacter carboxidus]